MSNTSTRPRRIRAARKRNGLAREIVGMRGAESIRFVFRRPKEARRIIRTLLRLQPDEIRFPPHNSPRLARLASSLAECGHTVKSAGLGAAP